MTFEKARIRPDKASIHAVSKYANSSGNRADCYAAITVSSPSGSQNHRQAPVFIAPINRGMADCVSSTLVLTTVGRNAKNMKLNKIT